MVGGGGGQQGATRSLSTGGDLPASAHTRLELQQGDGSRRGDGDLRGRDSRGAACSLQTCTPSFAAPQPAAVQTSLAVSLPQTLAHQHRPPASPCTHPSAGPANSGISVFLATLRAGPPTPAPLSLPRPAPHPLWGGSPERTPWSCTAWLAGGWAWEHRGSRHFLCPVVRTARR